MKNALSWIYFPMFNLLTEIFEVVWVRISIMADSYVRYMKVCSRTTDVFVA